MTRTLIEMRVDARAARAWHRHEEGVPPNNDQIAADVLTLLRVARSLAAGWVATMARHAWDGKALRTVEEVLDDALQEAAQGRGL